MELAKDSSNLNGTATIENQQTQKLSKAAKRRVWLTVVLIEIEFSMISIPIDAMKVVMNYRYFMIGPTIKSCS